MSRGVEARGSLWTPGVPRALGSFRAMRIFPKDDGVPGAAKKQGGGALPAKAQRLFEKGIRITGASHSHGVMPALVAGIHAFGTQDVDGRNKSGHDD